MDGGSTDNNVEIIKKFERWFAYRVSEPDRGQVSAINKSLARANGTLVIWINSDDLYLLSPFRLVAARPIKRWQLSGL